MRAFLIPLVRQPIIFWSVFKVFGIDERGPDGADIRDYIPVIDLADAQLTILAYPDRARTTIAGDLATDSGASVKEMIGAVERVLSRQRRGRG